MKIKSTNPVGAHISVAKGFLGAFEEAVSIGAEAMQIFAKSPMQSRLKTITKEESEAVKNFPDRKKIKSLVIHASYLLNFAKPISPDGYEIKSLVEDVFNAEALGGDGAIVHLGKSLEMDKKTAINNFVENIKEVIKLTDKSKANIILENTAGQGSELGFHLDEFGEIYKLIGDTTAVAGQARVKVCLETAHLFGAGYDLSEPKRVKGVLDEIERNFGVKNVACIHLNDAKKPLGSKVDRHEDVGHGTIGSAGLKAFINKLAEYGGGDIPLILETPQGYSTYEEQIKEVKRWL